MTPLSIAYMPLEALTPYAHNARTHSAAQVAQIAASIDAFGWTNPILIDEAGGIIAGHGRVLAAKLLEIDQVPCIRLGPLTKAQTRALIIADNKLALNAGWDLEVLATELHSLGEAKFDLNLTGFSELEVASLIGTTEAYQAQEIEHPADAWDGMPEYTHEDQTSDSRLIVHFATPEDRAAFANLIGQQITDKTKSVWYPQVEREQLSSRRYAAA